MAHPLCHALFTQLELGIKRYTYWAGGQKYFYGPDLLASQSVQDLGTVRASAAMWLWLASTCRI